MYNREFRVSWHSEGCAQWNGADSEAVELPVWEAGYRGLECRSVGE